jgi:hypothetical protein
VTVDIRPEGKGLIEPAPGISGCRFESPPRRALLAGMRDGKQCSILYRLASGMGRTITGFLAIS